MKKRIISIILIFLLIFNGSSSVAVYGDIGNDGLLDPFGYDTEDHDHGEHTEDHDEHTEDHDQRTLYEDESIPFEYYLEKNMTGHREPNKLIVTLQRNQRYESYRIITEGAKNVRILNDNVLTSGSSETSTFVIDYVAE